MEQHFVLCGLGHIGWRVLEYLRAAGVKVVVVDSRASASDPRLADVRLINGDCRQRETLAQADLANARGVAVLTSDDLVNISTALLVRQVQPDVRLVVRMFNQNLITRLGNTAHNIVALSTSALTAPLLALIARTGEALGTFRLEDGARLQIAELHIREDSPLRNQTIADALQRHQTLPIAHFPKEQAARYFHDIHPETRLETHDRLVVFGDAERLRPLLAQADEESLPELLWAGFVRRLGRVLRRTLTEVDLAVKICTAVLVIVIVASTLVFRYGTAQDTFPDAFYRTISLMATGADMGGKDLEAGGWQKVFVSLLRLLGTALTAAFTAILTNYLVRAHLGGALEVRRIPERGHIVVCGLGNIGFRVVEELLRDGERVVALERSRDNPFITTTRRSGVAVIIGDAAVPEVLRQANTAGARAIVAVTDNELANLEIALLAREIKATLRVVLRLVEPSLAQTLRQGANIRLALSIPELAAPAFVAALFGDRVHSVFFVAGRLLAVVDLLVQSGDEVLDGKPVRALAIDYQLMPIALFGADRSVKAELLHARLSVGDRLTVILSLSDLQRLLRREPMPAEYAVDLVSFPPSAQAAVGQLLRTTNELTSEAAELALQQLPVRLGKNLTRGQAEDLMYLLGRERATGKVRRIDSLTDDKEATNDIP